MHPVLVEAVAAERVATMRNEAIARGRSRLARRTRHRRATAGVTPPVTQPGCRTA